MTEHRTRYVSSSWAYCFAYLLTELLFVHHTLSVVFLKPTVSSRSSVPPSASHKCLRFGLCWHCTL